MLADAPSRDDLGTFYAYALEHFGWRREDITVVPQTLDVQPGTVCSCDQEVVAMSVPGAPGAPIDLHRLGKMRERLVVTPNLDHLLQGE